MISLVLFTVITASDPAIEASPIRFEIGRRYLRLERRWRQVDDPGRRRGAIAAVEEAVQAFFRLGFADAARWMDTAVAKLEDRDVTPFEGLAVAVSSRLVEEGSASIRYRITELHDRPASGSWCEWSLGESTRRVTLDGAPPWEFEVPITGVPAGDHPVELRFGSGAEPEHQIQERLSVVSDLTRTLESAELVLQGLDPGPETETARGWIQQARVGQSGDEGENFHPNHEQLSRLPAMLDAATADRRWEGWRRAGNLWLRLRVGSSRIPMRIAVPDIPPGETRPLLVAVHGAGGSENLFFDGHGAGHLRKRALELGWIFVTPGFTGDDADLGSIVDGLIELFPIDGEQVFVAGHSLGAARVLLGVARDPARYRGVGVISGGGRVRPNMKAHADRFFVAAGAEDFGLRPSRQVAESLGVECEVYPGVEHLMVVSECLDDLLEFFRRRGRVERRL